MRREIVVLGEVAVAVLCVVAAVLSWRNGLVVTSFPGAGDVPAFDATRYVGPWLILAAFLVTVAGVIGIDAGARTMHTVAERSTRG
ncbi:hypothetical protein ACFQZZ_27100 [Nocardia sp. GCM10030253]|uniref:hypothetical protein n=1 Tax=Nocardia sp. GCM10030253 TaxID=3273404 RepID=UPI00362C354F